MPFSTQRNILRIVITGVVALAAPPLSAQSLQPSAEQISPSQIARREATATPAVGEVAVGEAGVVSPVFKKIEICTARGCRRFIIDTRTGAMIENDGQLSAAYARTGRGEEIIRVKAFTAAERPKTTAQDDAPLKNSPRIRVRDSEQEDEAQETEAKP